MVATPFFGPFDVMRSTNLADNQLINLRPEIVETKDGKGVGALMGTPGLDLLATVGTGPINGTKALGNLLYVISGLQVYSVTAGWAATSRGAISGSAGLVSMIDNGTQLAIFTNQGAWVAPIGYPLTSGTIASTGYPLTGGAIGSGGLHHAIGDVITLKNVGGSQTSAAMLQVSGETGGVVTAFTIFAAGIFPVAPTSFTEASSTGVGTGFTLTSPTFGSLITGGVNYNNGDTIVLLPNDGAQSAAAILRVLTTSAGGVTSFSVLQTGAFQTQPSGFVQQSTSGSGSGFILSAPTYGGTQALAAIALPFTPNSTQGMSATYQDGFGLCNQPGTMTIWQSAVGDLSVWPALNFATVDGSEDNVMALHSLHRLIFITKQRTTEVWDNAGVSGFAFQPAGTVLIEHGTVSSGTVRRVGEALVCLSRTDHGQGIVRELNGYTPRRISTHAVETLLATAATLEDTFAYSYQQEGHIYYVLTAPSANLTLVYDHTSSILAGAPMWFQWAAFTGGTFSRHWGNSFAFFNQTSVLGDYRNGNLYRINLNTLTDNGAPRKWQRSWRALQQPVAVPMRFSSLQVDMQIGINVPAGTNPQVVLEWSDDGGHNWSAQHFIAAGPSGATAQRVRFNRVGSTRRNSGLDRIFRLSSSDVFPAAIIGVELDV